MKHRAAPSTQEELEGDLELESAESRSVVAWLRNMPCFALSALLHLILLLAMINIVYHEAVKEDPGTQCQFGIASAPKPKPPADYRERKRGTEDQIKIPGPPALADFTIAKVTKEVDEVTTDIPLGTSLEEAGDRKLDFSDLVPGNLSWTIGTGRGVLGPRGLPSGHPAFVREGGSPPTEDAVRAALEWLLRHQDAGGSWKAAKYIHRCETRCASERGGSISEGFDNVDVGVTALAMLAFAGYGHTHRYGAHEEYVECLRRAVDYMKRVQVHSDDPSTDGRFGDGSHEHWMYNHLIATMAMAELLVMSGDGLGLKKPVTDAVKLILHAQNDGFGWRYGVKPGDSDTSVTGWAVLALKAAKIANLGIPADAFDRAFSGALHWIDRATSSSGKTGYQAPGDEGSRLGGVFPEPYPFTKDLSCMTAVGVLCRIFAGQSRSSPVIRKGVDLLLAQAPRWQEPKGRVLSTINFYYWYYGSYALFQFGGEEWKKWNKAMIEALVSTQRQGDICEDGSWDPVDEWGPAGGRVYATALGAMTLEVYYRFRRLTTGVGG